VQGRVGLGRLVGVSGEKLHDEVIGGDVRQPGEHAALGEVDLGRGPELQPLVERANELQRVAPDVNARANGAAQSGAQRL